MSTEVNKLLPTSLVGSYAQPDWLIDREKLAGRFPPRTRARELWRIAPEYLAQAKDDATLVAIREQEEAGLDIATDGEICRESYSNRFAPRSTVSISTIREPLSTAVGIPIRCPGLSARYAVVMRWKWKTWNSCGPIQTG